MDPIDNYRTLYLTAAQYIFSSGVQGTFSGMDHYVMP